MRIPNSPGFDLTRLETEGASGKMRRDTARRIHLHDQNPQAVTLGFEGQPGGDDRLADAALPGDDD